MGIIAFIMLTLTLPFDTKRREKLIEAIKRCTPTKDSFRKYDMAEEIIDFLSLCLQHDKNLRPTARELLDHKWMNVMVREYTV